MLRELRESDAEGVAALFRSVYAAERPMDAEEIVSWVNNAELKPEWLRVLEVDGRVVGYGDIMIEDDEVALDTAALAGHWDAFVEWAEEQARAADARRVRLYFPAGHHFEDLARDRGYRLWRSSYTMEIVLDDVPPDRPPPPDGITFRPYRPEDEDQLRTAANEAFANDPFFHEETPERFREFNLRARGFDPALWLLAWDGEELAGFVLAFLERAGEPDLGWIGTLGVRAPWRRRGLGDALLRAAIGELHARGLRRVGLGVDTENETGALRLYERVGMNVVRQGNNWVRDL